MTTGALGAGVGGQAPWHFGGLHPYESALALGLAFGPFVVLAIVVVLRRRDREEEGADHEPPR